MSAYKISFSKSGWTGGAAAVWYDADTAKFYAEQALENEVAGVDVPTRECYRFDGFYSSTGSSATQYVDADGHFTDALRALSITSAKTFYAQGTRVSWKLTLDDRGGGGGAGAVYWRIDGGGLHADDLCAFPISAVAVPVLEGHAFLGYFNSSAGSVRYIDAEGVDEDALAAYATAARTLYARWQACEYTLAFDYNGGSGETASKSVTFGQAVGALPAAASPKGTFVRWRVGDEALDEDTVWSVAGDATAVAEWFPHFGGVADFFGLASSALVPVSSNSGDECRRVAVAHGGKYEKGVSEVGGTWRSPSVTYVVKAAATVAVRLGTAFPAVKTGAKFVRSGYMITSVKIVTEVGKFPTVTVSAVANEGKNAVNNFTVNKNKFDVSVPVAARARAQNLLGAIVGGGHLQRVKLLATCDPVVCEENLMPCASDIVNGRYELSAETVAPGGEDAPQAAAADGADGGFALTAAPLARADGAYMRYAVTARREMS